MQEELRSIYTSNIFPSLTHSSYLIPCNQIYYEFSISTSFQGLYSPSPNPSPNRPPLTNYKTPSIHSPSPPYVYHNIPSIAYHPNLLSKKKKTLTNDNASHPRPTNHPSREASSPTNEQHFPFLRRAPSPPSPLPHTYSHALFSSSQSKTSWLAATSTS